MHFKIILGLASIK